MSTKNKDILRDMIRDLANGNEEEASKKFSQYATAKSAEILGTVEPEEVAEEPVAPEPAVEPEAVEPVPEPVAPTE